MQTENKVMAAGTAPQDRFTITIGLGWTQLSNQHGVVTSFQSETPDEAQVVHQMRWNGEVVHVGSEGRFLNPQWANDRRKAQYLTADQAGELIVSRLETTTEVAERKLNELLRHLNRSNKQVSVALAQSEEIPA